MQRSACLHAGKPARRIESKPALSGARARLRGAAGQAPRRGALGARAKSRRAASSGVRAVAAGLGNPGGARQPAGRAHAAHSESSRALRSARTGESPAAPFALSGDVSIRGCFQGASAASWVIPWGGGGTLGPGFGGRAWRRACQPDLPEASPHCRDQGTGNLTNDFSHPNPNPQHLVNWCF